MKPRLCNCLFQLLCGLRQVIMCQIFKAYSRRKHLALCLGLAIKWAITHSSAIRGENIDNDVQMRWEFDTDPKTSLQLWIRIDHINILRRHKKEKYQKGLMFHLNVLESIEAQITQSKILPQILANCLRIMKNSQLWRKTGKWNRSTLQHTIVWLRRNTSNLPRRIKYNIPKLFRARDYWSVNFQCFLTVWCRK